MSRCLVCRTVGFCYHLVFTAGVHTISSCHGIPVDKDPEGFSGRCSPQHLPAQDALRGVCSKVVFSDEAEKIGGPSQIPQLMVGSSGVFADTVLCAKNSQMVGEC